MINYSAIKKIMVFILCLYVTVPLANSSKNFNYNKKKVAGQSRWTGRIVMEEIIKIPGPHITAESKRTIQASFMNALPTLYRDDTTTTNLTLMDSTLPTLNWDDGSTNLSFTDDKGSGSHSFHSEGTIGKQKCVTDCSSSGKAELHAVVIEEENDRYFIEVVSPTCIGTTCADDGGIASYEESQSIIVSNQRLGGSKDVLAGSKTETGDLPGGFGTFTRTTTWHFARTVEIDVELIVTPDQYDSWLPEPGRTERTEGTVMKISLKLQGRNGTTTTKKAKSFELRLSNTSTEPGMTINFPVHSTNTSPDLKFMPQANAVILDTLFQTMKIICDPGKQTAEIKIGSYDGGGWTVLNVEAVLVDNTTVQGRLLVSNGEMDIRIPKRDPNSKIAEAWLTANANPGEMDDKEKTAGNTNDGDGLTAYEEYRGVIAEGNFKRLDPNRKELGVVATRADFTLFTEGMSWFKQAGEIEIVRFDFDKDEIAEDEQLNMNKKSAHDYDQYALYLLDGGLGGLLGEVSSKTPRSPWVPANIIAVIIDWNKIQTTYHNRVNYTSPERVKFTVRDYLAQTVAHELGHGVNVDHHGIDRTIDSLAVNNNTPSYRIFNRNGTQITDPISMLYNIGPNNNGTAESGDMSCMLNYYPYYKWGYTIGADGAHIFNLEPLLPLGKRFCTSKNGTGINATKLYFGDGAKGNCLSQIKLRN